MRSIAKCMDLLLRFIAEGVATRDGVCAYDSFCTSKFLKTEELLWMQEDRLAEVKARCISCEMHGLEQELSSRK